MNNPKILYSLASRSRPEKLISCIDNIINLSSHDNYLILLTLDVDDVTVANKEFNDKLKSYGDKVKAVYGFSKNKIDAINKNTWMVNDFDILCNHSDDMVYIKEGFDLDIIEAFDNFDGLVHFPDQIQNRLITYAMMSKNYYDIDKFIYHPSFFSVYADNYQQDLAIERGKYKLIDKKILEHRHFCWGYGEKDALLLQTENPNIYENDRQTYLRLSNKIS